MVIMHDRENCSWHDPRSRARMKRKVQVTFKEMFSITCALLLSPISQNFHLLPTVPLW
jgi:hypothetical protein